MARVPVVTENWLGEPAVAVKGIVKLVAVFPTKGILASEIVGLGFTVISTAVRLPVGQYAFDASA